MTALRNADELLRRIRGVHEAIRHEVVAACEASSTEELSAVVGDDAGDTIFAIDRVSEAVLLDLFADLARDWPVATPSPKDWERPGAVRCPKVPARTTPRS